MFKNLLFYNQFKFKHILLVVFLFFLNSCSTIESSWGSVKDASGYIYDSVVFWEDEEPEESEAIIVEDAYQVPEFANQPNNQSDNNQMMYQQNVPSPPNQFYGGYSDPIYRSARQYYFVGPNGTPLPAPPPPPFPQYSIEQNNSSYSRPYRNEPLNNLETMNSDITNLNQFQIMETESQIPMNEIMSEEEEMELFGIENNCIRVATDYMNGGYKCDDFD